MTLTLDEDAAGQVTGEGTSVTPTIQRRIRVESGLHVFPDLTMVLDPTYTCAFCPANIRWGFEAMVGLEQISGVVNGDGFSGEPLTLLRR